MSVAATKVRTAIPGSRNAATSDCTDCGALKKVLYHDVYRNEAAENTLLGVVVEALVGAVVEEADELDAGAFAALQRSRDLDAERARADDDGGTPEQGARFAVSHDRAPEPGREPL